MGRKKKLQNIPKFHRKLGPCRNAGDPGRHGRFAAVDGRVYTRPCRTENQDVLLRVPRTSYFRTRYREMPIPMALSSEIFIDNILKKP